MPEPIVELGIHGPRWMDRLLQLPGGHPYAKFDGVHWRLVEIAELVRAGVPADPGHVSAAVDAELAWLFAPSREVPPLIDPTRPRWHASQDGNAVYACTVLGHGDDARVRDIVTLLLNKQWPDGGWNCDRKPGTKRSSFHESVTTALGLAVYGKSLGDANALEGARRTAQLLLEHRMFRRAGTGPAIHPSWTVLHYPPYWHYDILQGLRLLDELELIRDSRADDALEIVRQAGSARGYSGRDWSSARQPAAISYGRAPRNVMLNQRAQVLLARFEHGSHS